ncbi:hypothetical protein MPTK1_1g29350 [Marchantia polymorpha subsp. ruderalis]|uniref:Uncharacterized protein n=2 Tax=Marchantia polymorpha TaxID=3197 RepID=A0AAF6AVI3_MARPO|nr:hypothetical protein MARPO_0107s0050 [Marchantia polymorpha]BBN00454.1 hypothetical protein Mp_1g29350 [Marchantia polymorpha subsp. ruderalis]|eukprot:PTQ31783.1 hypothetical protein MARPO_0107s0050 [Marchantia polymorpha]
MRMNTEGKVYLTWNLGKKAESYGCWTEMFAYARICLLPKVSVRCTFQIVHRKMEILVSEPKYLCAAGAKADTVLKLRKHCQLFGYNSVQKNLNAAWKMLYLIMIACATEFPRLEEEPSFLAR